MLLNTGTSFLVFRYIGNLLCFGITVEGLTQQCQKHWNHAKSVNTTEKWARRMFDANGKKEAGIFRGNTVFEGDYQQCISIQATEGNSKSSNGLYCITYWLQPKELLEDWRKPGKVKAVGFCIPHTCTDEDAFEIFLSVNPYKDIPHKSSELNLTRCDRNSDPNTKRYSMIVVIVLSLLAAPMIPATLYDMWLRQKRNKPCVKANKAMELVNLQVIKNLEPEEEETTSERVVTSPSSPQTSPSSPQMSPSSPQTSPSSPQRNSQHEFCQQHGREFEQVTVMTQQPEQTGKCASIILSYSLYKNTSTLLSMKAAPGSYTCLNGLRFLSMAWIVLGHCYSMLHDRTDTIVSNVEQLYVWEAALGYRGIKQMWLAVETFFVISGMLVTLNLLKALDKREGRITKTFMYRFYLHRYLRLTPVYMVILSLYATVFLYIGSGPFFIHLADPLSCRKDFWRNALYIQNIFPSSDYSPCMAWTWYLANDFQFYCISPFFIILMYKHPRVGHRVLTAALVISLIVPTIHIYSPPKNFFVDYYIRPWNRMSTYFLGIMLGRQIYLNGGTVEISKLRTFVGWSISGLMFPLVIYSPSYYAVVNSILHLSFNLIIIWVIFACINGYGGVVNTILSWDGMIPLGKLTYVTYLIHPILLMFLYYTSPVQIYVDHTMLTYIFLGVLTLSVGVAFFLSLLYEVPVIALDKVVFPR